jgi:hypothetical protein
MKNPLISSIVAVVTVAIIPAASTDIFDAKFYWQINNQNRLMLVH